MVRIGWLLVVLVLVGMQSEAQPSALQQPWADGAYFVGPQGTPPAFTKLMTAGYSSRVPLKKVAGMTVLSLVVGIDGMATGIEVVQSHGEAFDVSAENAVTLSRFAPGSIAGKAVPVRVDVRVPFYADGSQAVPEVLIAERDLPLPAVKAGQKYTPPIPIHTADADFSVVDETPRKVKYPARVVRLSVDVDAEGVPTLVQIRRGLGFGADEKTLAAVKRYRFLPATKKGVPVAASTDVEVYFQSF